MPHLHDCKVIADLVEQGRSEVEWVYLRGGKGGGERKRRAWRNGGRSKQRRREGSKLEKRGKKGRAGKREEKKEGREQPCPIPFSNTKVTYGTGPVHTPSDV